MPAEQVRCPQKAILVQYTISCANCALAEQSVDLAAGLGDTRLDEKFVYPNTVDVGR